MSEPDLIGQIGIQDCNSTSISSFNFNLFPSSKEFNELCMHSRQLKEQKSELKDQRERFERVSTFKNLQLLCKHPKDQNFPTFRGHCDLRRTEAKTLIH